MRELCSPPWTPLAAERPRRHGRPPPGARPHGAAGAGAEPARRRAGPHRPRADLTQAPEHDGLKSMRSWLRGHLRLSPAAAGAAGRATGARWNSCPRWPPAFADGVVTAEQVAVIAPVAAATSTGRGRRAGRRPGRGRRGAGRDRRHQAARRPGPGGAALPGPARPRRHRTRPHRGPVADRRQARRRQRVRPLRARRRRRGEGAGRAGIVRPGRPAGRRHSHPRPAARRRVRPVGRQHPRRRARCRSCAPSSRTWSC